MFYLLLYTTILGVKRLSAVRTLYNIHSGLKPTESVFIPCLKHDNRRYAPLPQGLSTSRYFLVTEAVSDDDPIELIREVLEIEKGIASGLEKLLRDVETV